MVVVLSLFLARLCARTVLVGGGDYWAMVIDKDLANENGVPDEQLTGVLVNAKVWGRGCWVVHSQGRGQGRGWGVTAMENR